MRLKYDLASLVFLDSELTYVPLYNSLAAVQSPDVFYPREFYIIVVFVLLWISHNSAPPPNISLSRRTTVICQNAPRVYSHSATLPGWPRHNPGSG